MFAERSLRRRRQSDSFKVSRTACAAACLVSLVSAPITSAQQLQPGMHIPGEFIVLPDGGARAADVVRASLDAAGFDVADRDVIGGAMLVRVNDVDPAEAAATLEALRRTPGVRLAEPNGLGSGGLVPNDSFFASQWHLRNTGQNFGTPGADVDATAAWTITTGSPDVTIAVLDSGSDFAHPEFAGRLSGAGYDFVAEDADPEGDHPHGTWVAGVIAANANNSFAVAGVDHAAQILTIKVLNSNNSGSTFDQIQGVNFAAAAPEVDVINLSLINYPASGALDLAMADARAAGKIVIACAGNSGIGNADVSWPGASTNSISVGATDRNDRRASFSATGAALDFVAPGSVITTTRWQSSSNTTASVSGCSFATPLSAGVAGLLLARAEALGFTLDHDDVYRLFRAGAEDQVGRASEDVAGRDDFHGWGRINAYESLLVVADCNANGVLDLTDIALGTSDDLDGDGVPDECALCPGDTNGDGLVNADDLLAVLGAFGTSVPGGPTDGDLTGDGVVNADDLLAVLGAFGSGCS